jgi:hypothetical protein
MDEIKNPRIDHLTCQYIWLLENDAQFLKKAEIYVDSNAFCEFCELICLTTKPLRKKMLDAFISADFAFLYLEMWQRLDGIAPGYSWHSENVNKYRTSRHLLYEKYPNNPPISDKSSANGNSETDRILPPLPLPLPASLPSSNPQTIQEITMSNQVTFAIVTYINGTPVDSLTEEQLIDAIKKLEAEIKNLKAIETKSKKIDALIAKAEATLAQVVGVLDARA